MASTGHEGCLACEKPLKRKVSVGEAPLHPRCQLPCVQCEKLLYGNQTRVDPDTKAVHCAQCWQNRFIKVCKKCGEKMKDDVPVQRQGNFFYHLTCISIVPEPSKKPASPEPEPERELEQPPVESGNTIGNLFKKNLAEVFQERQLSYFIHDIELNDLEAELIVKGEGQPGSYIVYYVQSGRDRDFILLAMDSDDQTRAFHILDNNFQYNLEGHDDTTFDSIKELVEHYSSNPICGSLVLKHPIGVPEQYPEPDPSRDPKDSATIEYNHTRAELAVLERVYVNIGRVQSKYGTVDSERDFLMVVDMVEAELMERIELAKTMISSSSAFEADKFEDSRLLDMAVGSFEAQQKVAEAECGLKRSESQYSMVDLGEFEVEEIPDQNLLVETLQLFWTEQKFSLGERDKTVPEAIFKKITLNALSMRTEASITDAFNHRPQLAKIAKEKGLGFEEFYSFFKELFYKPFPHIIKLFRSVVKSETVDYMTIIQFRSYVSKNADLASSLSVIIARLYKIANTNPRSKSEDPELTEAREMFGHHCAVTVDGYLTIVGFVMFMLRVGTRAFDRRHLSVCEDMSQPLAHYFINSGHNSYLEGDQLKSQSTAAAYRKALLAGARCIELDLWDGPNGEPIIYHGHTLTSKVKASDVLTAIRQTAFESSPYPVILSLENHLSPKYQVTLVNHFRTIFSSDMVPNHTLMFWESNPTVLPSPEKLKKKIIIKNKAHPQRGGYTNDQLEAAKKKKKEIAQELSDVVVYCKSQHFKNFQQATKFKAYEMASFAEKKAFKYAKVDHFHFIRHTSECLARAYPDGLRFDSSNYDPQTLWNIGMQMCALNYQTPDRSMQLNMARFSENGRAGYVLKPQCLRTPRDMTGVPMRTMRLEIELVGGFQMPRAKSVKKRRMQTYVEVEVVGAKTLMASSAIQTSKEMDKPEWNDKFTFEVSLPELALLRFVVMDKNLGAKDPMGYYCIPLNCLLPGFRSIPIQRLSPFGVISDTHGLLFLNVTQTDI